MLLFQQNLSPLPLSCTCVQLFAGQSQTQYYWTHLARNRIAANGDLLRRVPLFIFLAVILVHAGCGSTGGKNTPPPPPGITVSITPTAANVRVGATAIIQRDGEWNSERKRELDR